MEEDRKRQDMIDEDHKLALWTQAQIDQVYYRYLHKYMHKVRLATF